MGSERGAESAVGGEVGFSLFAWKLKDGTMAGTENGRVWSDGRKRGEYSG